MSGVWLLLAHPTVAHRDCKRCQKYCFDEETGKETKKAGLLMLRHNEPPPCETSSGCAKISPTAGVSLNQRNVQAYLHYLECKATGQFDDDSIVKRNAGLVRRIEDNFERMERRRTTMLLESFLKVQSC